MQDRKNETAVDVEPGEDGKTTNCCECNGPKILCSIVHILFLLASLALLVYGSFGMYCHFHKPDFEDENLPHLKFYIKNLVGKVDEIVGEHAGIYSYSWSLGFGTNMLLASVFGFVALCRQIVAVLVTSVVLHILMLCGALVSLGLSLHYVGFASTYYPIYVFLGLNAVCLLPIIFNCIWVHKIRTENAETY